MTSPQDAGSKPTIILIDEDISRLRTIEGLLQQEGISSISCQSGQEALAAAGLRDATIATMNLELPDIDGLLLLRRLKQEHPHLRVIIYDARQNIPEATFRKASAHAFAALGRRSGRTEMLLQVHRAILAQLTSDKHSLQTELAQLKSDSPAAGSEALPAEPHTDIPPKTSQSDSTRVDAAQDGRDENWFRNLFQSSPAAILVCDRDGRLLDANPAACRLYRASRAMLLQKSILELILPEEGQFKLRYFQDLFKKGQGQFEGVTGARHKGQVPVDVRAKKFSHDETLALLLHIQDISVRQSLQKHLLYSTKMEAIQRLGGGIAHDLNNLLTVILGNAEFGLQAAKPTDATYKDLLNVEDAALQARDLVRQLLTFSRRHDSAPRLVDVNEVVRTHVQLLERVVPDDIKIETSLHTGLQHVLADPGALQEVFMNLSVNARDAMPNGGRLLIATENSNSAATLFQGASGPDTPGQGKRLQDGNFVKISVADVGTGMGGDVLPHIFDPFFTTKDATKNTGLGLSVVYGVVNQHKGSIDVSSEPGDGTVFHVYLPAVRQSPKSEGTSTEKPPAHGMGGRILVVDDNENVRKVAFYILQKQGYSVLEADNGHQALDYVRTEKLDLVILDVVMPGLSGPDTYAQIREIAPALPVIFVTGYDIHAEIDTAQYPGVTLLQKPYTQETLGETVSQLLA